MTTVVEMLPIDVVAQRSDTSDSTVRRAMAKWESGLDDGQFPPPLRFKRKGDGAKAKKVVPSPDFEDWLDRWPGP